MEITLHQKSQDALLWIVKILNKHKVSYQIAGGLAAKVYGAKRDLADIDIDIPLSAFQMIIEDVKEYVVTGPQSMKDQNWNSYLMTLNYQGQEIDLSSSEDVMIFNQNTKAWEELPTDLSQAEKVDLMGVEIYVISKENLLFYKKKLRRQVDLLDIEALEK